MCKLFEHLLIIAKATIPGRPPLPKERSSELCCGQERLASSMTVQRLGCRPARTRSEQLQTSSANQFWCDKAELQNSRMKVDKNALQQLQYSDDRKPATTFAFPEISTDSVELTNKGLAERCRTKHRVSSQPFCGFIQQAPAALPQGWAPSRAMDWLSDGHVSFLRMQARNVAQHYEILRQAEVDFLAEVRYRGVRFRQLI